MRTAVCRLALISVVLLLLAIPTRAQFAITSSSIADGQANVPLVDSIYFNFNQQLPFNSLFTSKFSWEPVGHFQRTEVFLGADRISPRFRLLHQQDFDFALYVFGVVAANGARMERPYALNYTTATSSGTRRVSGTVQFGARTPSSANPMAQLILEHHADNLNRLESRVEFGTGQSSKEHQPHDQTNGESGDVRKDESSVVSESISDPYSLKTISSIGGTQVSDLDHTVILLLDQFEIDEGNWSVRAAAAITETGTYSFDHVRDGTYYPIAFNYSSNLAESIGHYGYFDPDGDFAPDVVTVSGGNLANVPLTLYRYSGEQAFSYRALAESEATNVAPDAVLRNISGNAAIDGTSMDWAFLYFSSSLNKDIVVQVDPLTLSSSIFSPSYSSSTTTLPSLGLINSAAAIDAAETNGGSAYRSDNPGNVAITVKGGNQLSALPSAPTQLLWSITYSVVGSTDPPFQIYIDMITGEPYTPLPVELASFRATIMSNTVRLDWVTLSESNNSGFQIEQRGPDHNEWQQTAYVPGAGTKSTPSNYRVTLSDVSVGRHQFRLKQVGGGGDFHYSAAIEVVVPFADRLVVNPPYPNPSSEEAHVQLGGAFKGPVTLRLFDLLGREVQRVYDDILPTEGLLELRIDASSLDAGVYFLVARSSTMTKTHRLVVAR